MSIQLDAEALVKRLLEHEETWAMLSDFREVATAIAASSSQYMASDASYEEFCKKLENEFGEEAAYVIDRFADPSQIAYACDWLHYQQHLDPAVKVIKRPDFIKRLARIAGEPQVE